jgi:hypothetical protein
MACPHPSKPGSISSSLPPIRNVRSSKEDLFDPHADLSVQIGIRSRKVRARFLSLFFPACLPVRRF